MGKGGGGRRHAHGAAFGRLMRFMTAGFDIGRHNSDGANDREKWKRHGLDENPRSFAAPLGSFGDFV